MQDAINYKSDQRFSSTREHQFTRYERCKLCGVVDVVHAYVSVVGRGRVDKYVPFALSPDRVDTIELLFISYL